jgi:hypothetical protein
VANHVRAKSPGRARHLIPLANLALLTVLAAGAIALGLGGSTNPPAHQAAAVSIVSPPASTTSSSTTAPTATTTTAPLTTTTTAAPTTTTAPPPTTAPAPTTTTLVTPDASAGHVTAVGDSVMLDYQDPLEADIPGVDVLAAVSRQWYTGEDILQQMKASGQLGPEVIVALGTNGPITSTDFNNMMAILSGETRVVFVNVHVDQPWQDPNNAVIAAGVSEYPNTVLADWATLAAQNPEWFGPDGTHLAIDGPGADALAALITQTLESG